MEKLYTQVDVDATMLAGRGQRFVNYLIDSIVFYAIIFGVMGIASFLYYAFEIDGMLIWFSDLTPIARIVFNITLVILYYAFMESLTQRTIGKYVSGTKVVMDDGSRPEIGVAFMRTICRFIPFEPFSLFGENSRGWHDSIANTYVVDVKKYNEALNLKNSISLIGAEEI